STADSFNPCWSGLTRDELDELTEDPDRTTSSLRIDPLAAAHAPEEVEVGGLGQAEDAADAEENAPHLAGIGGEAGRRPVRERGLNEEGMADRKRRICLGGVNEARRLLDRWKPPAFSIADSLRVAVALGGRPILPSCLRRLLPHEPCLVVPDGFV